MEWACGILDKAKSKLIGCCSYSLANLRFGKKDIPYGLDEGLRHSQNFLYVFTAGNCTFVLRNEPVLPPEERVQCLGGVGCCQLQAVEGLG